MARLGNKKIFSGIVGNVVFRNLDGQQIVQSRPTHVKQSTATVKSANEFGNCSQWAKQLRIGITPLLVGMTDGYMYQRFTAILYNTLKKNSLLPKGERSPLNSPMEGMQGFEFNSHSLFSTYFKPTITAQLTTDKKVRITIAAFDPKTALQFPASCSTAEIVLYVYATNFKNGTTPFTSHTLLAIDKRTPWPTATVWETQPLPENYFVLAAAKLLYYTPNPLTQRNYLNSKSLSPAIVILAEPTGI